MAEERIQLSKKDRVSVWSAFDFPSRILELRTYAKWWLGILYDSSN